MAIINPVYWNRDYGAGFSFLFLLTTQMLGIPSHVYPPWHLHII